MALDFPVNYLAATVTGIESTRVATGLRVGALRRDGASDDELVLLDAIHAELVAVEARAVVDLVAAVEAHPLFPWVAAHKGVGAKQAARLFGALRDPYWNHLEDRPRRGPAELWAYCGFHTVASGSARVAPRHTRGARSNWSSDARKRTFLVARACRIAVRGEKGRYRLFYEDARVRYEHAVHASPCAMCGVRGQRAEIGTALRPCHQDARAMRIVCKEILRDLYNASRLWHQG